MQTVVMVFHWAVIGLSLSPRHLALKCHTFAIKISHHMKPPSNTFTCFQCARIHFLIMATTTVKELLLFAVRSTLYLFHFSSGTEFF